MQTIRISIDGRSHVCKVFPMEKIAWEGPSTKCPHCKVFGVRKALLDIIQYGLIDKDLCYTLFECEHCGESFAAEYTIDWSESEGGNG